jgi:hypothetical protein
VYRLTAAPIGKECTFSSQPDAMELDIRFRPAHFLISLHWFHLVSSFLMLWSPSEILMWICTQYGICYRLWRCISLSTDHSYRLILNNNLFHMGLLLLRLLRLLRPRNRSNYISPDRIKVTKETCLIGVYMYSKGESQTH